MGFEPSRRDDLESIGYMLIYFAKGKLPWQGLKLPKDKNKSKENKLNQIYYVKKITRLNKLCDGLPNCFVEYLDYVRNLKFTDTPDYEYLISLFNETCKNEDIKLEYEWDIK
jgi:serine/threonine protein kinase